MRITFLGAAREVTGSSFLVETCGKRILLDCGFYQGRIMAEERNYASFSYDPKTIDFLIICHAHLDHVGRIPKLVGEGFSGKIFSTAPTKEITQLVLEDSYKLMKEESRRDQHLPLYSEQDIAAAMQLFETVGYNKELEITDGVKLLFKNAGHILGSAVALLSCSGKRLVYTSDLGNSPCALLPPPETIDRADYVICETTYGGRIHEDIERRAQKLTEIIKTTIATGGVLLIPTFAIERAQELLHDIEHFCTDGDCAIPTFYLDSPLAQKVTKVFEKYPEFLSREVNSQHESDIFGLSRVKITSTVRESQEIESGENPKIIMAGSGMMNGGRILYHLENYIGDPKNTVLIVGYQAKGTLGRRLLDGEDEVRIFGKRYKVAANIRAIGSYSAHADSPQLLSWLSKISGVEKIFLVHGESDQSLAFAKLVKDRLSIECEIPQQGESFEI
ncbi:MBL fold metallo-hydrolase [Candidatus Curtissbacteria bacterium]|nr:MBL fold metallo-hydrolase [Candidatus Curtissbacteria bacterium]